MAKIKKRTQAQTPAPKKDQKTGSAKNPKGSASGSRGGIEISDQAVKALQNMIDKHNDQYKAKSKKVDMGMLKAVFVDHVLKSFDSLVTDLDSTTRTASTSLWILSASGLLIFFRCRSLGLCSLLDLSHWLFSA